MTDAKPSFFARVPIAFRSFFAVLSDPDVAVRLRQALTAGPAAEPPAPQPAPKPTLQPTPQPVPPPLKEAGPDAALQLLGLLQREARFIDFVEEEIGGYSDEEVGGAARIVHEGCRKAVHEYFTLTPVRQEAEGSPVTLEPGFDAAAIRVTGNVVGTPPFKGSLAHRGWRATEIRLPKLADGHDTRILAPAEVEL